MKKITCFIILLFLLQIESVFAGWRPGEMEVKVTLHTPADAERLGSLGLNGDIYRSAGYALLYVTPEELDLLKATGLPYEILKEDLSAHFRDFWSSRDQYHTYDEIIQAINTLCFGFPNICVKYDYGLSVEGRQLLAMKISDNAGTDENEPEVMFDGGIHGDEIGGPENLIRFAQDLCAAYNTDPYITELINTREIWLYIMVNPDGRVNMVRYNSNGVDLNRDWGYMWDEEGGSTGYYSQVETRALRNCMYENQFVVHTTYHSGTEYLSYPWSYRPDPCPDQPHIDNLAIIYESNSGYSNLPYGQGYTGMYAINGSSKDTYYAVMGSVGWTMEISLSKQPPASQIMFYYNANKPSMLAIIEHAGFGISGTVTDAETGEPVRAMIFVNNFYPTYNDPVVGDFHKYLTGGTYTVRAVAAGYQPQEQTVTVPPDGTATVDFSLQPGGGEFAYRVTACVIPGNNFDDEGTTYFALGPDDGVRYSIGRAGWIILDMGISVLDGPGSEIKVHEGDNDPEGYAMYAGPSQDGPWVLLGNGTGTSSFDFTTAGVAEARFIRISDDGNGASSGNNAGFDLDAVEILEQPQIVMLMADSWIEDPAGNNNGRIDPGESCTLYARLRNHGGMTAANLQVHLNYAQEFILIENTVQPAGNIAHSQESVVSFPLVCSPLAEPGHILMTVLNVTANAGDYVQSFPMHFTVGAIVEDWESGGFSQFDWSSTGAKQWVIEFLDPYEGAYAAKSGNIDNGQASTLELTLDVIGYDDISFYRKVSSQANFDILKFFIDNVLIDQWSGNLPWEQVTYPVSPGMHTFTWTFQKDQTISQGFDAGYLDYIVLPSANLAGELKVIANAVPYEFCGPGEAHLGAYTTGGNAPPGYVWTPAGSLNNAGVQFPLAIPDTTTSYQVTVTSGAQTANADILVTVYPIPEQAVVIQQGDSLISSSFEGNQWYSSEGLIEGATGPVFYPEEEDYYHVIVSTGPGCSSDPSDPVYFLFTDIAEHKGETLVRIYPNPADDQLHIAVSAGEPGPYRAVISDIAGRPVAELPIDARGSVIADISTLPSGLFVICIRNSTGSNIYSSKFVK